jgi:translation initiation factor 2 alpha subunit (eIF-2alpha)
MRAAQAESSDDCEVKMKLVAPPLYVLTTYTLDKAKVGNYWGGQYLFLRRQTQG